jgi:hypothetical protein
MNRRKADLSFKSWLPNDRLLPENSSGGACNKIAPANFKSCRNSGRAISPL